MSERNVLLQRELRKVKHEQIIGPADETLPEGLELLDDDPKPLTADDRLQLTNDLKDPEKCDAAAERLMQASPTYAKLIRDTKANRAYNESRAFASSHPDFYQCRENAEAIMHWCIKRNLAPTQKNFELAFDRLKQGGFLVEAPIAAEELPAKTQPELEPAGRITSEETAPQKRPTRASSGLTRDVGSPAPRNAQPRNALTWAAVDRMSDSEYRQRSKDPAFLAQVNALPPR
jgi:hypothetical protein